MKTHAQVIEFFESRLLRAMTDHDVSVLYELAHPDIVLTTENGELFIGIKNLHINDPNLLRINTIDVHERNISFFNNVAVVNTFEKRTGEFRGIGFEREYRLTRVWKFNGRTWQLISTSIVLL